MSATDHAAFQQALSALDANHPEQAEPILRRLVARYPASYPAAETLAQLFAEAGNAAEAVPLFKRAVALAPHDAVAHANLGAAYLAQSDLGLALPELQAAARLDPTSPQTLSNLGRTEMLRNRPTEAAAAFAEASKLQPGDSAILYNEAVALAAAKRPADALSALSQVPDAARSDQVSALRGDLLEQTGAFQAAVVEYQHAAELKPTAQNVYALDVELLRHWTWDQALTVSRYGARQYPQDSRFPLASSIALFAKGDYQNAAQEASGLLKANPDNSAYADLLGRSCEAAGEAAGPQCAQLETFANAHPQNARVAVFAATAILERPVDRQDQVTAQRLLAQAVRTDPQLPEAHYQLAVLAQQSSQWEQSRKELETAIALKPDYAEAHYRLSRAYAHLGRRDDAKHENELHQQYSEKQKDSLNARMQDIVLFLLKPS